LFLISTSGADPDLDKDYYDAIKAIPETSQQPRLYRKEQICEDGW